MNPVKEKRKQGWKILKFFTRPTSPYVLVNSILNIGKSKFLLVLQHKALAMASGRVDFSSPGKELIQSNTTPDSGHPMGKLKPRGQPFPSR